MSSRAICAFVLVAFTVSAWCACPTDPVPPEIPQFMDEVGARPLRLMVGAVHLANVNHATVEEQQQIVAQVVGVCFLDGKSADISSVIAEAFQDRGFFRARVEHLQINILDKNAVPPKVAVAAYVQEGFRYRLKEIQFADNKAIANTSVLRMLFKLDDGDIFRREAVVKGIQALRKAYGAFGYIDFTPVPDMEVDEKNRAITVKIDCDEGRQFVVRSFPISGADPQRQAALLADWKLPPGSIYNGNLVDFFFAAAKDLLPPGATPEHNLLIKRDRDLAIVDITLDLGDSR